MQYLPMIPGPIDDFRVCSCSARSNKLKPVQIFFNVCTGLVAAGLGWETVHYAGPHWNPARVLVAGCAVHLLVNTVAVASIICLTESQNPWRAWSEIVQLSFPYSLASTGLASMAAAVGGRTGWPMLIGTAAAMLITYRSYRVYFGVVGSALVPGVAPAVRAKSAAAAQ